MRAAPLAALVTYACACACACAPAAERPIDPSKTVEVEGGGSKEKRTMDDETRALHALFDAEWEHDLEDHPTTASALGDRRYDDRWDDVSLAAAARRDAHDREVLAAARALRSDGLSDEDRLSLELFRYKYATAVAGQRFRPNLFAIDQRGGIQTADELADAIPFETTKNYEAWNARLRAFGTYAEQTIETLAEAARAGYTHPKIVMARVGPQLAAHVVSDATKSPFYAPYGRMPTAIPEADKQRLAADARRAIEGVVVPAFRKLEAFFRERYLPACKDGVGAWQLPDGEAFYAYAARLHTTTTLGPDDIHAIGLREVARIRGEMESVKARAGFAGTMKEFFAFLRTDPRFFAKDGPSLLTAYRDLAKRVDPELVKVFSRLPRAPYGVQPIPDAIAPDTTTAYYRPGAADGSRAGTYFVNLYRPSSRPTWEMTALTLHEAVPGHHLQIALAQEDLAIPKFRRHSLDYTAYVEGWALYAESLGDEMGLYDDPYAKFGQLAYEMWRAIRLVVDTGIHHGRWDRQRAIDFFLENSPKTELDVVNEIDRYIAWPGQALAYKIGELKIRELRRRRQAALGNKFDLKAFHESVLSHGPLPLDVLEREVMVN